MRRAPSSSPPRPRLRPSPARWLSWQDWFAHHGIRRDARRDDLTFDSYQLVLQAALQGQGVALGWTPLVDDMLADGRLVRGWPAVKVEGHADEVAAAIEADRRERGDA